MSPTDWVDEREVGVRFVSPNYDKIWERKWISVTRFHWQKKNRAQLYKGQMTLSNGQIAIQWISDCETFGVLLPFEKLRPEF